MKAMDNFVAAYHVSLPAIRHVEFKLDDFVGAMALKAFLADPKTRPDTSCVAEVTIPPFN